MANQEHLSLLKQGVTLWNEWREQHQEIHPDLRKADLSDTDLHDANLYNTNLREANLRDADLRAAKLQIADLSGANLRRADLRRANLDHANLSNASLIHVTLEKAHLFGACFSRVNLSDAYLSRANLDDADLSDADLSYATLSSSSLNGTNLSRAILFETTFARVDLRTTRGLAEIRHQGFSHIELYSIQLPQDGTALPFLRGAGAPDEWINDYQSHMMHPVLYHSLFISYSSKDEALARRLHVNLQNHGVRCWFAPEDMKIGDKIRPRIDEAIYLQDKLLLLLSEYSLASSWVGDEVEAALEKELQQQREVLFPIRLDESVMQTSLAWAAKLRRTRHIGDFTNWTDMQAYRNAFDRLLRDLKRN